MMRLDVRVPATSANLGPGFDALGLAFALYNEFTFEFTDAGGDDPEPSEPLKDNMVLYAYKYALEKELGASPGKILTGLRIKAGIPRSRGLGSSAACIVAGVAAAFAAAGGEEALLDKDRISNAASVLEGHPDNASAAVFGGFTVSLRDDGTGRYYTRAFSHPDGFGYCVLYPDRAIYGISTEKSRLRLPEQIPHADAAFGAAHAAMVAASFITGDGSLLEYAVKDKLHQPYRIGGIPGAEDAILICKANGARVIYLSGSGPALMAVLDTDPTEFAASSAGRLSKLPGNWLARPLLPDNEGFKTQIQYKEPHRRPRWNL